MVSSEAGFSKATVRNLIALVAGVGILAITGLALLTTRFGWKIYLEIFSHFQVQYFLLALLLLVVLCLTRRKPAILIGLFCCAVLATQVIPWYIPPQRFLPHSAPHLRVLVANLNTQNRNYAQVVALVRKENPDLAVFIEVDQAWVEQLNSLNDFLPYSFGQPNPYNQGLMVYSQKALINPRIEFFGAEKNTSVVGQVAIAGQTLSFVATHPLPPVKSSFFHSRNRQLDLISQYLETVAGPVVLMGDLNLSMWSPYYRRLVSRTGLRNARQGFGILPTWPTPGSYRQAPGFTSLLFSIPIDHCLISPELQVTNIHTGSDTGSDHRPVIVDLHLNS